MEDAVQNVTKRAGLTEAQRHELEAELKWELERLERSMEQVSAGENVTLHAASRPAVAAPAADEQEAVAAALHGRVMVRRAAVLEALERMRAGTYGICATCRQPIPYGRLIAVPETSHCVACGTRP